MKSAKPKDLTGEQGVMIPESNVQNLMLKEEVVEAVKAGQFNVYSVKTIDEGIEVLTGTKAGERRADGTYEEGTVNYLVDKQLREMADKLKRLFRRAGTTKKTRRVIGKLFQLYFPFLIVFQILSSDLYFGLSRLICTYI